MHVELDRRNAYTILLEARCDYARQLLLRSINALNMQACMTEHARMSTGPLPRNPMRRDPWHKLLREGMPWGMMRLWAQSGTLSFALPLQAQLCLRPLPRQRWRGQTPQGGLDLLTIVAAFTKELPATTQCILHAGSGGGLSMAFLGTSGYNCYGVDLSSEAVQCANDVCTAVTESGGMGATAVQGDVMLDGFPGAEHPDALIHADPHWHGTVGFTYGGWDAHACFAAWARTRPVVVRAPARALCGPASDWQSLQDWYAHRGVFARYYSSGDLRERRASVYVMLHAVDGPCLSIIRGLAA